MVGVATLLRSLFLAGVIQERSAMHLYRRHIIAAVITGLTTGFVIGLTSAGSGTLIAIALIAIFRLTPQRVVGTDVFHAAVLLWAAGIAHWIGGNIDFLLAGTILVGSIPGVIVGTNLSVKAPQKFLRYALAVVLIASGTTLIAKNYEPGIVLPAIGVASIMVGLLFGAQAFSRSRASGRTPAGAAACRLRPRSRLHPSVPNGDRRDDRARDPGVRAPAPERRAAARRLPRAAEALALRPRRRQHPDGLPLLRQDRVYSRPPSEEEIRFRAVGKDWPLHGLTMTGLTRLDDLQACVESVVADGVEGDLIEAGVWRGGASILMRATLDTLGEPSARVWLADSFQGFPAPDAERFPADAGLDLSPHEFLSVPVDEVRSLLRPPRARPRPAVRAGLLPRDDAEPARRPLGDRAARRRHLRVDLVSLEALYPGLAPGGYLIIDDYGFVPACREAVDDYRREHGIDEPIVRGRLELRPLAARERARARRRGPARRRRPPPGARALTRARARAAWPTRARARAGARARRAAGRAGRGRSGAA